MFRKFILDQVPCIVKIENFKLQVPLCIKQGNDFLSCDSEKNIVDWYFQDDGSGRQRWIIDFDETSASYTIRSPWNQRRSKATYLGAPNRNKRVFLYSSNSNFTKWSILPIPEPNHFILRYIGCQFAPKDISLVVARYSEDVDWTNAYSDILYLYNKKENEVAYNWRQLPNIGREGHTYLHHIITNYQNLSKQIIFTQGDPFEHNETFLWGIDHYNRHFDVQPLGLVYLRQNNIPPSFIENELCIKTDYGLNYLVMNVNGNLLTPLFNDPGIDELNRNFREDPYHFEFCNKSLMETFLDMCQLSISKDVDNIRFTYSALFSCQNYKIKKYSVETYRRIMQVLVSRHSQGGVYGYILERLWLHMFED